MLTPSYAELMEVINRETSDGDVAITSRYTIVIAAAKRARQLIDGDEAKTGAKKGKPLSIAVDELYNGKIKIVKDERDVSVNIDDGSDELPDMEPTEILELSGDENSYGSVTT